MANVATFKLGGRVPVFKELWWLKTLGATKSERCRLKEILSQNSFRIILRPTYILWRWLGSKMKLELFSTAETTLRYFLQPIGPIYVQGASYLVAKPNVNGVARTDGWRGGSLKGCCGRTRIWVKGLHVGTAGFARVVVRIANGDETGSVLWVEQGKRCEVL